MKARDLKVGDAIDVSGEARKITKISKRSTSGGCVVTAWFEGVFGGESFRGSANVKLIGDRVNTRKGSHETSKEADSPSHP